MVLTALRDATGQLHGFAKITRDITERKRTEQALREANATLESKVDQRTAELEHRARQLQKLTLELSEAEDRERKRLAEILHDDLQQILAAAKFHLSLLGSRVKSDPSQQAIVTEVEQMLMEAIQKSRSLSHELSPATLHQGDLAEILGWLAGQVRAKHGLSVTVEAFGNVDTPSDALKMFLYKAAQELLFNVVKHARVNEARIRVRRVRAVPVPVGLGSGPRLRPAGAPGSGRVWAAQHPRAHRAARRTNEDLQCQRQGQHVSHCGAGQPGTSARRNEAGTRARTDRLVFRSWRPPPARAAGGRP